MRAVETPPLDVGPNGRPCVWVVCDIEPGGGQVLAVTADLDLAKEVARVDSGKTELTWTPRRNGWDCYADDYTVRQYEIAL